ncbi:AAA family ATPase [Bifidobacterium catulorum]|uniref:AAA family ATPase n=1 Tax=Bifidobacterium catulorum TaxID=1630173 RepID=UPI001304C80F|nr:AAA family ATPase [Bifidobacterium catulorum]
MSYYCDAAEAYPGYVGRVVGLSYGADGVLSARRDLGREGFANLLRFRGVDGVERRGVVRANSVLAADWTFTVGKAQSLAWALGDASLRGAVESRARLVNERKMGVLASRLVTRVGGRGEQVDVHGLGMEAVVAVHHTSRAGDPHLHLHTVVVNRTKGPDGRWHAFRTRPMRELAPLLAALETYGMANDIAYRRLFAARGLTLMADGSVPELEDMAARASKRRDQAERELGRLVAEWRERNRADPDEMPPARTLHEFRRLAWKRGRPAKAKEKGVDGWLKEFGRLPDLPPLPVPMAPDSALIDDAEVSRLAVDRLLGRGRSAYSRWDVEAEVVTILGERRYDVLGMMDRIGAIAARAVEGSMDLGAGMGAPDPGYHRRYTSPLVLERERRLRSLMIHLHVPDTVPDAGPLDDEALRGLDGEQRAAVSYLRSGGGLKVVEGAAGTGKTTMLKTAVRGLDVIGLTPSKQAANVLGGELELPADSVQKLIWEHGWRMDEHGVWRRRQQLEPEDAAYRLYGRNGPRTIVIDEAGMLGQDVAEAVLTLAELNGCPVWMIGDRAQLPAVGAGGVLHLALEAEPCHAEMTITHRFRDPAYAALTLRMRDRKDPGAVFDALTGDPEVPARPRRRRGESPESFGRRLGDAAERAARNIADILRRRPVGDRPMVERFDDAERLVGRIAAEWRDGTVVSVRTRAQALAVNTAIHSRLERGGVLSGPRATGRDGIEVRQGDLIATRRNDRFLGVANRRRWRVASIDGDGLRAVPLDGGRAVTLPMDYVADAVEYGYAATVYGNQGVTGDRSITWLDEASTANGMYVGQTRGRGENRVYAVAGDLARMRSMYENAYHNDAGTGLVYRLERDVRAEMAADLGVEDAAADPERLRLMRELLGDGARALRRLRPESDWEVTDTPEAMESAMERDRRLYEKACRAEERADERRRRAWEEVVGLQRRADDERERLAEAKKTIGERYDQAVSKRDSLIDGLRRERWMLRMNMPPEPLPGLPGGGRRRRQWQAEIDGIGQRIARIRAEFQDRWGVRPVEYKDPSRPSERERQRERENRALVIGNDPAVIEAGTRLRRTLAALGEPNDWKKNCPDPVKAMNGQDAMHADSWQDGAPRDRVHVRWEWGSPPSRWLKPEKRFHEQLPERVPMPMRHPPTGAWKAAWESEAAWYCRAQVYQKALGFLRGTGTRPARHEQAVARAREAAILEQAMTDGDRAASQGIVDDEALAVLRRYVQQPAIERYERTIDAPSEESRQSVPWSYGLMWNGADYGRDRIDWGCQTSERFYRSHGDYMPAEPWMDGWRPYLDEKPGLREALAENKRRDPDNPIWHKEYTMTDGRTVTLGEAIDEQEKPAERLSRRQLETMGPERMEQALMRYEEDRDTRSSWEMTMRYAYISYAADLAEDHNEGNLARATSLDRDVRQCLDIRRRCRGPVSGGPDPSSSPSASASYSVPTLGI